MFKNFIKTWMRHIRKHKSYSLINVLGLTIGLTCAILILLWIQDELSMDRYHENGDHICQAYLQGTQNDNVSLQSTVSPAIGPMLKSEYPEIKETVRIGNLGEVVFKVGETRILENRGIASDPSIASVFTYKFLQGNSQTALQNIHSIILTESLAKKYFGEQDALGQIIRLDDQADLSVTGVISDLPHNTFRPFDFIVPFELLKERGEDIVGTPFFPCSYNTYVLLKDGIDYEALSDKISKRIFDQGDVISFAIVLQPFSKTYFLETGGKTKILILGLIALMILGIACINFMNLATARSTIRSKEIGVRKVTGAAKSQIASQFIGESILLTFVATLLALLSTQLILRPFNAMTGKTMAIDFANPLFLLALIGLAIVTGTIAGLYPALFLSKFQPVKIFKQQSSVSRKATMRKVLIITQFVFSIIFIISTVVLNRQLAFIKNFNLGVNEDNVLYVRLEGDVREKYEPLRHELLQNPDITSVTTASTLPISIRTGSFFAWGKEDAPGRRICHTSVGLDYFETFDMQMAQGRAFSKDYPNDAMQTIVINEAAAQLLEDKSPVGKPFFYGGRYLTLIGIVKDFQHNKTLTNPVDPLSFVMIPSAQNYLFIKMNPAMTGVHELATTVNYIRTTCDAFSPERPLTYQYLNEFSFEFNRNMEMIRKLIFYSTLMAIVVSCLGLFGLSAFLNEQRTKEIGIRKILGASVSGLVIKSSREFSKWVIIATALAWPIAWFAMRQFLQNFAYSISLSWWLFLTSGGIAMLIALITVSFHAIKAATANPVEALRYE